MKIKLWLLALVSAVMLSVGPVLADGDFYVIAGGGGAGVGTKISSLPCTISNPGFYYVAGNLSSASGEGITVTEDNVTIDLMGFCLTGKDNTVSGGIGINVSGRKNVEIRNGTLRNWNGPVYGGDASNNRIINIRAVNINSGFSLSGSGHVVKGCSVSNCTTMAISIYSGTVTGNQVSTANYGIYQYDGTISGNTIFNCGIGIEVLGGASLIGNTTTDCPLGIWVHTSLPNLVDQNTAIGSGTHYLGGDNAIWAGKSAYYPYGNNAGH